MIYCQRVAALYKIYISSPCLEFLFERGMQTTAPCWYRLLFPLIPLTTLSRNAPADFILVFSQSFFMWFCSCTLWPVWMYVLQLEWNMKLWWPHCEALIAYLMAYSHSREPVLLDRFKQIYDYTFTHVRDVSETFHLGWGSFSIITRSSDPSCSFLKFSDEEHGEWFGYLNRQGEVVLDVKGGPYKGE